MKKILIVVLLVFVIVGASCNKNTKIDVSNLNEEILSPKIYEFSSNGFVGVIFNNFLCYGPKTYISTIPVPNKNEFENGEYINGIYKLENKDFTYIVGSNKMQINNSSIDLHFEYEKNNETLTLKYYLPEFNFSYTETIINDNIKIEFNWADCNGNDGQYEIYVYEDCFEVVYGYYSPSFYITKEVYNLDGTFSHFVVDFFENVLNAYPLSSFDLKEMKFDNILCLVDKEGNLFKSYHSDDEGIVNDVFEYQNETKFIMIREDLITTQLTDIKDLLSPYTPLVLDVNSTKGLYYQQIKDSDEWEFYSLGSSNSIVNIVSSKVNGQNVTRVAEGVDVFGNYSSDFVFIDYPVEIYLPDTIQEIGKYAFAGGDKITKISIPNSCDMIGKAAFYGCKMLEEVILPESLEYLQNYTFTNCSNLRYLSIPQNLKQIGSYVFQNCNLLTEVNFKGTITQWEELTKHVSDTLYNDTNIEKIICSDGIIEIK